MTPALSIKRLLPPLWLSLLLLPFRGVKEAAILFVVLLAFTTLYRIASDRAKSLSGTIRIAFPKAVYILPAFAVLAVLFPAFSSDYMVDVAILTGIYIILAEGLNVVVGYTGLLHLGYVAFYAIGAYAYALLTTRLGFGFWEALPFSMALSTAAGALLAIPALRLRGDYLAIVTLGFGEITRLVLNNWDGLTKGPNGISGIPRPSVAGYGFDGLAGYYYFVLAAVFLSIFVIKNVCNSKIGRAWVAIREDEIAAASSGINAMLYKFYSLAFGSFWAGLAGALFAAKMQFISPESFTFMESVVIICMVVLGGQGTIAGPIVGALILVGLPEALRGMEQYRMLILGGGLVLLMIFRPQGILGGGGSVSA